jgi:hypothetical protein
MQACQQQLHAGQRGDGGRNLSFQMSAKAVSANNSQNSGCQTVAKEQAGAKRSSVSGPELGERPCTKRARQDLALQGGKQQAFFNKGFEEGTDQAGWKLSRSDGLKKGKSDS